MTFFHFSLIKNKENRFSSLEMAERHDAQEILRSARELILELQKLIDNKWWFWWNFIWMIIESIRRQYVVLFHFIQTDLVT